MMGKHLQAASDEPDLIPAARRSRVLIHGNHVSVSLEFLSGSQNLPQQADLTAHRLLCGRPEERPDSQSESSILCH